MSAPARFVAALPMYDFPSTAAAQDALWAAMAALLRKSGIDAPLRLTRGRPLDETWRDPGLLFGQTCGYPLMTWLSGSVVGLATPLYAFDGCRARGHVSFIVARSADPRGALADFRGARAAFNAPDSDTGMNLFRRAIAPLAQGKPFFASVRTTRAHAASLAAVASGEADLAAIDCVSFALIGAERPRLVEPLKILARTAASPNLPFVASASLPKALRAAVGKALSGVLADPTLADARRRLGLLGAAPFDPADFDAVLDHEREAVRLGYSNLA